MHSTWPWLEADSHQGRGKNTTQWAKEVEGGGAGGKGAVPDRKKATPRADTSLEVHMERSEEEEEGSLKGHTILQRGHQAVSERGMGPEKLASTSDASPSVHCP